MGREIAIQLASLGATVLCVDKNKSNNDETIQAIKDINGVVSGYTCDITSRDSVKSVAEEIKKDVGDVSMLFYCCGIPSPRSLLTQPPQDIHDTLDLTLTSYFWVSSIQLAVDMHVICPNGTKYLNQNTFEDCC